jgi:hypothetical protein
MDLWNEINGKHRRLMTHLMTFPGIAVVTARGKDVAALDSNGRPIEGSKEYKVEGQKNLAFDATLWLRVSREHQPMVIGARSVHAGVRPGVDRPRPVPGLTLEKVVFDVLRCDPAEAVVRDVALLQTTDDEPVTGVAKNPGNDPARRRMYALLGKAELTDREAKLAYVIDIIGRPVDTSNDLTDAEVRLVCDRLDSFIKQIEPSEAPA